MDIITIVSLFAKVLGWWIKNKFSVVLVLVIGFKRHSRDLPVVAVLVSQRHMITEARVEA